MLWAITTWVAPGSLIQHDAPCCGTHKMLDEVPLARCSLPDSAGKVKVQRRVLRSTKCFMLAQIVFVTSGIRARSACTESEQTERIPNPGTRRNTDYRVEELS